MGQGGIWAGGRVNGRIGRSSQGGGRYRMRVEDGKGRIGGVWKVGEKI